MTIVICRGVKYAKKGSHYYVFSRGWWRITSTIGDKLRSLLDATEADHSMTLARARDILRAS